MKLALHVIFIIFACNYIRNDQDPNSQLSGIHGAGPISKREYANEDSVPQLSIFVFSGGIISGAEVGSFWKEENFEEG